MTDWKRAARGLDIAILVRTGNCSRCTLSLRVEDIRLIGRTTRGMGRTVRTEWKTEAEMFWIHSGI